MAIVSGTVVTRSERSHDGEPTRYARQEISRMLRTGASPHYRARDGPSTNPVAVQTSNVRCGHERVAGAVSLMDFITLNGQRLKAFLVDSRSRAEDSGEL